MQQPRGRNFKDEGLVPRRWFALCLGILALAAPYLGWGAEQDSYWSRDRIVDLAVSEAGAGSGNPLVSGVRAFSQSAVAARPAVTLSFLRNRGVVQDTTFIGESMTGVFTHAAFSVSQAYVASPEMPGRWFPFEAPLPFFVGLQTGSVPTEGLLTWSGAVLGMGAEGTSAAGHRFIGDVDISIDSFIDPKADVSMTNLFNITAGWERMPLRWSGLAVQDGGFARGGEQEDHIQARFFGPAHEEIAGTFQADGLVGAFGAQRGGAPMRSIGPGAPVRPGMPGTGVGSSPTDFLDKTQIFHYLSEAYTLGLTDVTNRLASGLPVVSQPLLSTSLGAGPVEEENGESEPFGATTYGVTLRYTSDGSGFSRRAFDTAFLTTSPEAGLQVGLDSIGSSWSTAHGKFFTLEGQSRILDPSGMFLGLGLGIGSDRANGRSTLRTPIDRPATWQGRMIGVDTGGSSELGIQVTGDATVTLNSLLSPRANVAFSSIVESESGRSRDDMSWSSLRVTRGAFRLGLGTDMIEGLFVGPYGSGVIGNFERNGIRGSFGAERSRGAGEEPAPQGERVVEIAVNLDSLAGADMGAIGRSISGGSQELARALANATATDSEHGGVTVETIQIPGVEFGEGSMDIDVFGGWLVEGFFAVTRFSKSTGETGPRPWGSAVVTLADVMETAPLTGGMTWRGAMVGIDVSGNETDGNRLRGDAMISVSDVSYLNASVEFTSIVDLATNSTRSDMSWLNIPIMDGAFASMTSQDSIKGQFIGEGGRSVVGSFEWQDIAGAFGATRPMIP